MIRHIVAFDQMRGMAKNGAMPPWKLPEDEAYFTEQTLKHGAIVLMGRKTFSEALKNRPLKNRTNYVVTRDASPIPGATVVNDLKAFTQNWPHDKDLWIIGGAEIFAQTLDAADELYITKVEGEFDCDRFYPLYEDRFEVVNQSERKQQNGVGFTFCVYRRRESLGVTS